MKAGMLLKRKKVREKDRKWRENSTYQENKGERENEEKRKTNESLLHQGKRKKMEKGKEKD